MLPHPDEYPVFYSGYIQKIKAPVADVLATQADDFAAFIHSLPEDRAGFAYAPGKWTVAEVLGHIIDTERVMTYRTLFFARDNSVPQPGFDENIFVRNAAAYRSRSLSSLAEEFSLLRKGNLFLFYSLDNAALQQKGIANGGQISVRALLYVIAGHLEHHRDILKERYLL